MKRLMRAILWILCYGGACWFGIKTKLGFDILSQNHWKLLFDKSAHANWPSSLAPQKIVCKVLLVFIIVGILGLSVVSKKKKTRIPVVKGELPTKESARPSLMASQGRIAAPAPIQAPSATQSSPSTAFTPPPPPANLMGDAIRKISQVANTFDTSIFPHVKLENTFTQLVISDDATALLLKILPQAGTWRVTPAELPEQSEWQLDDQPPKNVLKDIIDSTSTLTRLEPEAQAISVVVLTAGNIDNAADVKSYLEKNGIKIATLDNQNMPDIPTWQQLLGEFYQPKQKEGNNETDTAAQNV